MAAAVQVVLVGAKSHRAPQVGARRDEGHEGAVVTSEDGDGRIGGPGEAHLPGRKLGVGADLDPGRRSCGGQPRGRQVASDRPCRERGSTRGDCDGSSAESVAAGG